MVGVIEYFPRVFPRIILKSCRGRDHPAERLRPGAAGGGGGGGKAGGGGGARGRCARTGPASVAGRRGRLAVDIVR